jgi:hypothetical protein
MKTGGRPAGAERQALLQAAEKLVRVQQAQQAPRPGATWRDMAAHAQVGLEKARHTVSNMARAGLLQPVGDRPEPHARRPMVLYVPRTNWATDTTNNGSDLASVMTAWRSRR